MSEKAANAIHFLISLAFGIGIGFYANCRYNGHASKTNTDVQVDSVKTQVDTNTVVSPEPSDVQEKDTVYIRVPVPAKPGTHSVEYVPVHDTTYIDVPIPVVQKTYEDSTYRAVVSGPAIADCGPRLDSLSIYNKTVTVYQTKTVYSEPSRWSIGVQAGYGASKEGLSPYIGIGIQYSLWTPKRRRISP